MTFNSIDFLIFFPIVTIIYFIIPSKLKWIWLLVSSYYFYMCWNPKYAILIAISTISTYLTGLLIEKSCLINEKNKSKLLKRFLVLMSFLTNLGILFLFKYYKFFTRGINVLISIFDITVKFPAFDFMLPVGISFYTFQALSYTIDVYRGDIKAEKNLGKYALFVSFFPQLVAGPIVKSKDLLHQFNEVHNFEYLRVKNALVQMLWGYFKKIFIADRLAILVNTVFDSPSEYGASQIIIASIFFTFQIYCDFSSYSDIAIGAAKVMGFILPENFRQPYLSKSIKDFWRRWHITLSSWFKDYVYIPLGGNKKGSFRKYLNIMIVFLLSGLWHGASLTFIIWGVLHGIYEIVGGITRGIKDKIIRKYGIRKDFVSYQILQVFTTFFLVSFAWIFFRANSFNDIRIIFRNLFLHNESILQDGTLFNLIISRDEFIVAVIGIVILIIIDILKEKINLLEVLSHKKIIYRWGIYISIILIIIILGVYGSGYSEQQFIYCQF
ncbi:MBOAT family O-acyltransferase [Clostridium weizhouense]|uniref:MBOAT family protein n=1 Tax=Clostridium weizhouense TaxID=2859781 RepID=A0ABS7AMR5_9CLOT|nr:MBOAT family O-acyltransferase [Clostridium weizhouense]MBW6409938.1 MBOAT family protein [Clostridium weizhouense]